LTINYVNVTCRFCNPLEMSASQAESVRDFEFARQELAAKQNARYVLACCILTNA